MRSSLLKMYVKFQNLKSGEEGQDLVEYALLLSLIALVCISAINTVANQVMTIFNSIASNL